MISIPSLLSLAHLTGLALGVGAATVKLVLLLRCRADAGLVPVYLRVAKPITLQIVLGLLLLTVSGIGWLLLGYPVTPLLLLKMALVGIIWVLGGIIDHVVEPRFRKLAPAAGAAPSPVFLKTQTQHLALEIVATALFYAVISLWVLR